MKLIELLLLKKSVKSKIRIDNLLILLTIKGNPKCLEDVIKEPYNVRISIDVARNISGKNIFKLF